MIPYQPALPFMEEPHADEAPHDTWTRLYRRSQPARERAQANAALTIPEAYLPDGGLIDDHSGQVSYQSIGYRGVNNIVNVMANLLFRTSRSFFRLAPSKEWLRKHPTADTAALEADMAAIESRATEAWVQRGDHDKLIQALIQVAVVGQAVLWFDKDQDVFRVVPFRNYCIDRLFDGSIGTLIIAEQLRVLDLREDLRQTLLDAGKAPMAPVALYTRLMAQPDGKYLQEVSVDDGPVIPDLTQTFDKDKLPFATPFWSLPPEASYGISLVDGLRGDLHKLNILAATQTRGILNILDWRTLVNPGGLTDIEDFKESEPGDPIAGKPEDIAVSVTGDPKIVELITAVMADIERRLAAAFLVEQATFRTGERVTAEEVRRTVDSLERQYTGIYAAMAHHLQQPLARWILDMVDFSKDLSIDVTVVTGLDALSRATEADNLQRTLLTMAQLATLPDDLRARMKQQEITTAIGAGYGVDMSKFLIPEEEFQKQQEQLQQQQMAMQVAATNATQQNVR